MGKVLVTEETQGLVELTDPKRCTFNDVLEMCKLVKDNWSLCNFTGDCESETMIAQTLHACRHNKVSNEDIFFSYSDTRLGAITGGGLANNPRGFGKLLDRGYILRSQFEGYVVLLPTVTLMRDLRDYFKKGGKL